MKTMMIRSLAASLFALALAPLAACAAPDEEEATDSTQSALAVARPGDLVPGIGASACTEDTCAQTASNDCSKFDSDCEKQEGCGVETGGNPILSVHSCKKTETRPSQATFRRPTGLVAKEPRVEEECFDAGVCNDLIAACIGGDHIWVCHTYGALGQCVHGECVGAP